MSALPEFSASVAHLGILVVELWESHYNPQPPIRADLVASFKNNFPSLQTLRLTSGQFHWSCSLVPCPVSPLFSYLYQYVDMREYKYKYVYVSIIVRVHVHYLRPTLNN
jgi:hypothetical protein